MPFYPYLRLDDDSIPCAIVSNEMITDLQTGGYVYNFTQDPMPPISDRARLRAGRILGVRYGRNQCEVRLFSDDSIHRLPVLDYLQIDLRSPLQPDLEQGYPYYYLSRNYVSYLVYRTNTSTNSRAGDWIYDLNIGNGSYRGKIGMISDFTTRGDSGREEVGIIFDLPYRNITVIKITECDLFQEEKMTYPEEVTLDPLYTITLPTTDIHNTIVQSVRQRSQETTNPSRPFPLKLECSWKEKYSDTKNIKEQLSQYPIFDLEDNKPKE